MVRGIMYATILTIGRRTSHRALPCVQVASLDSFAKRPGHFYRFWGGMSEAYAKAPLHEGYTILNRWRERCEVRSCSTCRQRWAWA